MENPVLYIVIPCYNEQEVLPITAPMFLNKLHELAGKKLVSENSRIMFVNDGSSDGTWDIIRALAASDEHYIGISQSRNRGHQNAVLAGLMEAKDRCDISISIDCDGQDDINAMDDMVRAYLDGCDIVYGVRNDRETDSLFKRTTAQGFYKFLSAMGADIVYNHADYRLISARALHELAKFKEVNLFLRGMVPLVGYRSTNVYYDRNERFAGESKYPLKKMLSFAFDGITSFSISPIRMISAFGAIVCVFAFIMAIYALVQKIIGHTGAGWASLMVSIWFIGGVQLLSVGLIGEYIGKLYKEVKRRPRYIIEAYVNEKEKEDDK